MALTTDVRHAVRLLGRSPVFTATSIVSLALGSGAAATIYSLTDALLFEPTVGVKEPSRVVDIGRTAEGRTEYTVIIAAYVWFWFVAAALIRSGWHPRTAT